MPPLPVIPSVFRVTLNWSAGALVAANVIHVKDPGATQTAMQVLTEIKDVMTSGGTGTELWRSMFAATGQDVGLVNLEALPLDGTSTTSTISGAPIVGGGGAGDVIPSQAAVVTLRTGIRGRSYRGRVFTPFVVEGKATLGTLTGPTTAAMQAGWEGFRAGLVANSPSLTLEVASYKLGTSETVDSVTAQPVLGTIRGRQSQLRS